MCKRAIGLLIQWISSVYSCSILTVMILLYSFSVPNSKINSKINYNYSKIKNYTNIVINYNKNYIKRIEKNHNIKAMSDHRQAFAIVVLLLIVGETFASPLAFLDNPLAKRALKKIGITIPSLSEFKKGTMLGKKGGIANFGLVEPQAPTGSEASVLVTEGILKVIDELQRLFTLALDVILYFPYGIPAPLPMNSPALTALTMFGVMSIYDTIEVYRKKFYTQEYMKLTALGPKGFTCARNLALRHRVDLGKWKDSNPI